MTATKQETRIYEAARGVLAKLKRRRALDLPGGRWEASVDFKKVGRLTWIYKSAAKEPFAIVPEEQRILGLGALGYGYAEKKLKEARAVLKPKRV